ncbi:MAG: glycosyltransferase family 4 protein [Acidimicrobiales bacterium]
MTAIDLARTPSEPTESLDAQAAADPGCEELASEAIAMGLRKIEILAWRDLDDPEAGGSELHSHRIASRWAEAGLEVNFRTSAVPNQPAAIRRSGYEAVRRNGRYGVFAAAAYEGVRSSRTPDALVEVWNGMPFFSPLWFRGPRIVFLHHVHAEMWRMVLPGWLAAAGRCVESVLAPRLYRRSEIVTLSQSSKDEIVTLLKLPGSRVTVVPPGVDPRFTPGGKRSAAPLVVAVGRLVPVKRFDLLMHALALVKREHPTLKAVIIGEGYERDRLEALRRQLHADSWITLPGRVDEAEVRSWYRRAWVVASTSLREGWGMTLTEAGACRTPGVATRIAGHRDAVLDGETGLLADGERGVAGALTRILSDEALRRRLGRAAEERARAFTWDATARSTLATLVDKAKKHTGTRARTS